jgi:hypothetical protein
MLNQLLFTSLALCATITALWAQEPTNIMIAAAPPPPSADQAMQMGPSTFAFHVISKDGEFPGRTVTGAPFSAHEVNESVQTLADGNRITQTNESQLYRDSQGRVRHEITFPAPPGIAEAEKHTLVTINDPVAGATYSLEPEQHIARKLLRPTPQDDAMFRAKLTAESGMQTGGSGDVMFYKKEKQKQSTDQAASEDLGTQVIEGVMAKGTRVTTTIPAGAIGNEQPIQIVSERWYSADLQTIVLSKLNDPRIGETIHKLTNINRAEPDASLFQVPAGYSVQDGNPGMVLRFNAK